MKIIACKIRKEHAELFKKYASDNGTTPNALLKSYILKTIGKENNKPTLIGAGEKTEG